jgi:hypothetical protein
MISLPHHYCSKSVMMRLTVWPIDAPAGASGGVSLGGRRECIPENGIENGSRSSRSDVSMCGDWSARLRRGKMATVEAISVA